MKASGRIMVVMLGGALAAVTTWFVMRQPASTPHKNPMAAAKVKSVARDASRKPGVWVARRLADGANYAEPPASAGAPVVASIQMAGQPVRNLTPNQVGAFPRVIVRPGEKISAEVTWPAAAADDEVLIQMEDGGQLDNGAMAKMVKLDARKALTFEVNVSAETGMHRVALNQGEDRKVLEFWVAETAAVQ